LFFISHELRQIRTTRTPINNTDLTMETHGADRLAAISARPQHPQTATNNVTFWAYFRNFFNSITFYIEILLHYLRPLLAIFTLILQFRFMMEVLRVFVDGLLSSGAFSQVLYDYPLSIFVFFAGFLFLGGVSLPSYLLADKKLDADLVLALRVNVHLPITLKKLDHGQGMNDLQLEKHDIDLHLALALKKDFELPLALKKLELDHDLGMNDLQLEKHDIDLYLAIKKLDRET
jgi:hypothetical protein